MDRRALAPQPDPQAKKRVREVGLVPLQVDAKAADYL